MTKLGAIIVLTQIKNAHETMPKFIKRLNEKMAEERIEALDLAIESLSAEPSGDLISRQDAIEVANKIVEGLALSSIEWDELKIWAKELFDALPSADRPQGNSAEKEKSIEQFLTLLTINALSTEEDNG